MQSSHYVTKKCYIILCTFQMPYWCEKRIQVSQLPHAPVVIYAVHDAPSYEVMDLQVLSHLYPQSQHSTCKSHALWKGWEENGFSVNFDASTELSMVIFSWYHYLNCKLIGRNRSSGFTCKIIQIQRASLLRNCGAASVGDYKKVIMVLSIELIM